MKGPYILRCNFRKNYLPIKHFNPPPQYHGAVVHFAQTNCQIIGNSPCGDSRETAPNNSIYNSLKYDLFKKDNQKNCCARTRLLPSNFIVLINTDNENYGQFILTEQSE